MRVGRGARVIAVVHGRHVSGIAAVGVVFVSGVGVDCLDYTAVGRIYGLFSHLLGFCGVGIGYTQGKTQFKRVGEAYPFVDVAAVYVVNQRIELGAAVLVELLDCLAEFLEKFVVHVLLGSRRG